VTALDDLLTVQAAEMGPYLHRRFPAIPQEDLEQQFWVGVLPHRAELEALIEEGETVRAKMDARQYAVKAGLVLAREQDRHERGVRALKAGYGAEDECFYSVGLLRKLIPAYLDSGITENPPKGRDIAGPGHGDPAEGGNWRASMIDVDYAYWKISAANRNLLGRYFSYPHGAGGWTHIEIASAMGIQPVALEGRVSRALRAMQRKLGGSNPWFR
jgi:hypothetical protein